MLAASTAARRATSLVRTDPGLACDQVRVLAGQHKAMTTYFTAVLGIMSAAYGLPFRQCNRGFAPVPRGGFMLNHTSDFETDEGWERAAAARIVKIVRDPRDLIVSGYSYHKWTDEAWANTRWDGNPSLKERLNSLSTEEGLMLEIRRVARGRETDYLRWIEPREGLLVLRYEDLMGDDREALYRRIFEHWQFSGAPLEFGVKAMRLFEFESRTGRKPGQSSGGKHLRSGKSGGWRSVLTPEHLVAVEEEYGEVIAALGYPAD
jgi:hypothetical protein